MEFHGIILNEILYHLKNLFVHYILIFANWYLREAASLIPSNIMFWLVHGSHNEIVIYCGDNKLKIQDNFSNIHFILLNQVKELIDHDQLFSRFNTTKAQTYLSLMFDRECFFSRCLFIPNEALQSIPTVVNNDILHNTPFDISNIYYGYDIIDDLTEDNKSKLRIWIIDKRIILNKLSALNREISDIKSIYVNSITDMVAQKKIINLYNNPFTTRFFSTIAPILIIISLTSIILTYGIMVWRQNMVKYELELTLDKVSPQAKILLQQVNKSTQQLQIISSMHSWHQNTANIATILEYVSGLLPDDTFITDLKISETDNGERIIDLTGLSDIPTSLPLIMDASKFFYETNLTSALSFEAQSKKTSFSLRSKFQ